MTLKWKNIACVLSLAVYLMAVLTILSSNYSLLKALRHLGTIALLEFDLFKFIWFTKLV